MITTNEILLAAIIAGSILAWRGIIATERIRTAKHRYSQPKADGPQHALPKGDKRKTPGRVPVTGWPDPKTTTDPWGSQIKGVAEPPRQPAGQPADLPASQYLHRTEPGQHPPFPTPPEVDYDGGPTVTGDPLIDALAEEFTAPQRGPVAYPPADPVSRNAAGEPIVYRSPFQAVGHEGPHHELNSEPKDATRAGHWVQDPYPEPLDLAPPEATDARADWEAAQERLDQARAAANAKRVASGYYPRLSTEPRELPTYSYEKRILRRQPEQAEPPAGAHAAPETPESSTETTAHLPKDDSK